MSWKDKARKCILLSQDANRMLRAMRRVLGRPECAIVDEAVRAHFEALAAGDERLREVYLG